MRRRLPSACHGKFNRLTNEYIVRAKSQYIQASGMANANNVAYTWCPPLLFDVLSLIGTLHDGDGDGDGDGNGDDDDDVAGFSVGWWSRRPFWCSNLPTCRTPPAICRGINSCSFKAASASNTYSFSWFFFVAPPFAHTKGYSIQC